MVTCRVAAAAVYDVAAENEGEGVDWSIRLSMSAHNINPSSIGNPITKIRVVTRLTFIFYIYYYYRENVSINWRGTRQNYVETESRECFFLEAHAHCMYCTSIGYGKRGAHID